MPPGEAEMKPTSSGYADVNGIKLYYEVYGEGEPVVLIHGGLTTIGEMQGWVQPLAAGGQGACFLCDFFHDDRRN